MENKFMRRYEEELAKVVPGASWTSLKYVPWYGILAGLTEEEIIDGYHARGVRNRDGDIRRECASARTKQGERRANGTSRRRVRALPKPTSGVKPTTKPPPKLQFEHIEAGRAAMSLLKGAFALSFGKHALMFAVREVTTGKAEMDWQTQICSYLLAHYKPSEILEARTDKRTRQAEDKGLLTCQELMNEAMRGNFNFELITLNALSGEPVEKCGRKPSWVVRECVLKPWKFMLLEFDGMDLKEQIFFWVGVWVKRTLPLVSLVWSGNKSIHATIEVDADTPEEYEAVKRSVVKAFGQSCDERYNLDVQTLNPEVGARVGGAWRKDTEERQELLFVRGEWTDRQLQRLFDPPYKPVDHQKRNAPPPWVVKEIERSANAAKKETAKPTDGAATRQTQTEQMQTTAKPDGSTRFAYNCATCPRILDCKRTFDLFWLEKSSNGVGCNFLAPDIEEGKRKLQRERVRLAEEAARRTAKR